MSEEENPQPAYVSEECDVFHKVYVWLQFQSKFIEANPRETWSPAPPITPPPPPARTMKSAKSSPRYLPYFVRDGPRSPVILFNEPPRAATPEEVVLPPPPPPPMLGPLPPISEILGMSLPQLESTFVIRDSPESPTYIVRDSPESPNSESWKFDPIFNWQTNADRKSSSYENTNPDQTGPSEEEDPEKNLCHCRECLVLRGEENPYPAVQPAPVPQAVQQV